MLESQGGTVIDQPQLVVRPQEIRILDRTIWVLNQAVEPHNGRRELVIHSRLVTRTEALSVRQQLKSEIWPDARSKELPEFWCGSSIGVPGGMSISTRAGTDNPSASAKAPTTISATR